MMDQKKQSDSGNSNNTENNKEVQPNKDLKPPKFFLISEGVISKTETADLSELVEEKKEKYSSNKQL